MRVSAVAREQAAAGFEGIEQVEGGNRAARSMRLFAFARQHQRGTSVFFYYLGRSNTDHAPVPSFAFDDHTIGVAQGGLFFQAALDALPDAAFFILALGIEFVEAAGDFSSAFHVFYA